MYFKTAGLNVLKLCFLLLLTFLATNCAERKTATAAELPADILGISVGMPEENAKTRLQEIAKLVRVEERGNQIWQLKDDSRFSHLFVGFNKEKKLSFVTALTKQTGGTPITFNQIGDASTAKKEINEPNYRYTWQVEAKTEKPAYQIIAQGNKPENLSMYTMSALPGSPEAEAEKEEEEER